ncbi:hypothetical protein F2Q69_00044692 [Brassica cretica]|uniref:Uncharacterized protein n=1 Tax=Brassica cretica TaxID=69181 RepID=A0A8S9NJW9_BRACR|nr:hypothetical protein F2Q69_00044692 [Brassica cretica]
MAVLLRSGQSASREEAVEKRNIPSIDINKPTSIDTTTSPSIDTTISPSIDTTTSSSIDTGRVSEQKEFDVCGNLRDGDTTTRSEMYGGKKRKRIKDGPHVSLTPHYSDCVKKSRVKEKIRGRRVRTRIDDECAASINRASLASIDRHLTVSIDIASRVLIAT